ncbi:hypothetical protein F5884DRAFT_766817 [Xylogone sp. PMI_703]|nr:hypothetical protein F5884DRAFT_766817 [Xylogone sp. PMI_703]
MPAPGEQHLNNGGRVITNPFEEAKPRISEYTAQEIATLQSRLEKQLGPEYISSRAGPSGQRVHYLAAEKCIQLANEIFGFNGWSSQIMDIQVDFVDENPNTLKVSLGLSVIVRVTLRDGTFHEDIGYGHIENCKGKAAAFEKAKKEGTTDALKRALRNFGNVLGNCIYDKDYLSKVTKIKVQPTKFDVDNLHRHSTHAPPPVRREPEPAVNEDKGNGIPALLSEDTFDDEFGDFDEADFSVPQDPDSHPDEVILPATTTSNDSRSSKASSTNSTRQNPNQPPSNRPQAVAAPAKIQNGIQAADRSRGSSVPPQQPPQTPNKGFTRSASGSGVQVRPLNEPGPPKNVPHPQNGIGRVLNQPSRMAAEAAAAAAAGDKSSSDEASLPPPGTGFFSARAAASLTENGGNSDSGSKVPQANLPAFNPHAESPSIRKTPGIDHNTSKPINKDLLPRPSQGAGGAIPRPNIFNPQLDTNRKIGVPGSPSVLANRGQYRPPTIKRPIESTNSTVNGNRTPLVDLPTNGVVGDSGGGDVKRQKMNG